MEADLAIDISPVPLAEAVHRRITLMTDALPTATLRLSPLELASGAVWGADPGVAPLPPAPAGLTARAALEDVVRRALQRPLCVVSFSGGRDSSAVLALAMHVARRDGLPLPIPVTMRFPRYARANEDEWQQLVIRHLGVSDWTRLVFDDELDIVGPYARRVLAQHGLLWPVNAHAHLPIAEQAAGGSLLTGVGGDELLSPDALSVRVNRVLMRQVAPRPRDVLRIGAFYAPRAVRRMAMRRRSALIPACPWLTPAADRAMRAGLLDDAIAEPLRWDESLDRGWWRSRYRRLGEDSLRRVAAMCGVAVFSPLTEPAFLAAFAVEGGRLGFLSRTDAMRRLVGDLLPEQLLARPSKAEMGGAFWNRHSADFAADWDGTGVDPELVQVDTLRRIWTDPEKVPDFRTFGLLHLAWLAAAGADGAQLG